MDDPGVTEHGNSYKGFSHFPKFIKVLLVVHMYYYPLYIYRKLLILYMIYFKIDFEKNDYMYL